MDYQHQKTRFFGAAASILLLASAPAWSAVLPEDRSDVLYHRYAGGGITIDGPSVLLRKKVGKNVSVSANYYVDMITSASIDVVTTASPYTEERKQASVGVDYLRGGTIMSVGFTKSDESDFDASTYSFAVTQNMFGDLTTVTLAYGLGSDIVGQSTDPTFARDVDRQQYAIGVSQILTRNLIVGASFEGITDEGYLNNPYRSVRYLNEDGSDYLFQGEVYPNTRTSAAASVRGRYYLPYRAAVSADYRFFSDTWGIVSHTAELGYVHPLREGLIVTARYRYYTQEQADFYADLFPRVDYQNFLARDKELSTFDSHSIGAGVSWEFGRDGFAFFSKGKLTLDWDHVLFRYDNFRDLRVDTTPGEEPLYELNADVVRLFVSFWY
jgi:hypothetical protein